MPYIDTSEKLGGPLSIHYRMNPEAPSSNMLVCVHELGGSLESFCTFSEQMAPRCRVLSFDQRGSGLSEHPVATFTMQQLADDLDALLDALNISQPVHLMGVAMGSVTALRYAVTRSHRLASLILCEGTGEIEQHAVRYILDRAALVREEGMRATVDTSLNNAFRGLPHADTRWPSYRNRFLANAPLSYALISEALGRERFTDTELAQVQCDTLVISGEHDFIWPPKAGQQLAKRIPGARFMLMPGAAHFPHVQCPRDTAVAVWDFISQQRHS
jgi:3-oxoadipate enol-lactonase